MAYEIFKTIITKDKFFEHKHTKNIQKYNSYVIKAKMLQRDNFTCQNVACPYCHNIPDTIEPDLTQHHVKFQKNGGKNTVRNSVTTCRTSQDKYHAARDKLVFDNSNLPPHINGQTFKLDRPDKYFWKRVRNEMKKLRKELKLKGEIKPITWTQLQLLYKFLDMCQKPYKV